MIPERDTPVILVLNAGSSSIKFALFETGLNPMPREAMWHGKVEGIGGPEPLLSDSSAADATPLTLDAQQPYHEALDHIRARVRARLAGRPIAAIAHRVVHGGTHYFQPTRIDAAVLADLRSYIPLAPLHQPFALEAIEVLLRTRPDLPQVACFDTGFHHTLPEVETMLPLPYEDWEHGLRRYGFHGLSYHYQSIALAERYGDAARGKVVVAHLGNGASLCGLQDLRSVATTMGFSALDGLMMGTRSGSVDPGALIFLMEIRKLSLERVSHILYHESGLLGVSGLSSDPRVLFDKEAEAPRAAAALALYVRRFVHEFGALVAALGGIDMLVFTAGIGEHSAAMRERLCAPLGYFGIALDAAANAAAHGVAQISDASSKVKVVIEPTNEEWIAARHAMTVLAQG